MTMTASEFKQRVQDSHLPIGLVLMDIFDEEVKPEEFPPAFDANGNVRLQHKVDAPKLYQTWCPHHEDQKNGDSYTVYTEKKNVHCFNGACILNKVRLNLIDCVSVYVFKLDPHQVQNLEVSKGYFWKSARWLVEKYGDLLELTLSDIERDPTAVVDEAKQKDIMIARIRKAASEYYHFLIHHSEKGKEAKKYLWEERGLRYGKYPSIDPIIDEFKLGVAFSSYKHPRLYNYLTKNKFKKEDIIAATVCNDYDGTIVDAFKSRHTYVTFPTMYRSRYSTIAGRNIDSKSDEKHYKLFGNIDLPAGLDHVEKSEEFMIVEGEMDKVSVFAMGGPPCMESRGTNGLKQEFVDMIASLREHNPDVLKRCYLAYDPDGSGRAAAENAGKRLVDIGIEVLVVRLPKKTVIKDGVEVEKAIDPNDILRTYKEKAVEFFQHLLDTAISFDAFIVLSQLGVEKLQTKSAARMAFKRVRSYIDPIPADERLFIFEEVLDALDEVGIPRERLEEGLKMAWFGVQDKEVNPGLERALTHQWMMVTDKEEVYEVWDRKLMLPNAVLLTDADDFRERLSGVARGQNITLDEQLDPTLASRVKENLPSVTWSAFTTPSTYQNFNREDLFRHIHRVS